MKDGVLLMKKRVGETPLQALDRLRVEKPELAKEKLSYAGRLDPLAEGELLVLVGEECKHREKYLGLDKTYIVDILFGIATDTHDVLGLITDVPTNMSHKEIPVSFSDISKTLTGLVGPFTQKYPLYSSKPYEGKPLFAHARLGRNIEDDDRPDKDVTIYSVHVEKSYTLTMKELQRIIIEKIKLVKGDFRQKDILEGWNSYFVTHSEQSYLVVQVNVHCSPGTYMRVLADEVGKKTGTGALALHIKRESIELENKA